MPIHAHLPVPALREYRSMLLELVISYLLKQPADCLDFALDFFLEKKSLREEKCEVEPREEEEEAEGRETIYAGSVDWTSLQTTATSQPAKEKILESLESFFLFSFLDEGRLSRLVDSMWRRSVEKSEVLMRQSQDGDLFFVIEKGYFQEYRETEGQRKVIKTYGDVGCFGGLALLYNKPLAYTVQALTPGRVYLLDRETFRKLLEGSMREKRSLLMESILKVPFFRSLSDSECHAVVDSLEDCQYQPEEYIYRMGELTDRMYFLLSGEVEASYMDEFDCVIKKIYSVGDHFGETSFLSHSETRASCIARTHVQLAFLAVEKFERLFGPCIEMLEKNNELGESVSDLEFGHYKEDLNLRISYFS